VRRHGAADAPVRRERHGGSLAGEIGRALGLHRHELPRHPARRSNAVLSRFPCAGSTPGGHGVRIDAAGRSVTVFNLHLADAPYQPYQLARIAYDGSPFLATEGEAIVAATAARGRAIKVLERDLAGLDGAAVVIAGDFNEPSFRDWTTRAAADGRHPLAVAWPATRQIEALGFTDAYRAVFPDEMAKPGHTWAVLPGDPEHHDRIDFVFARGPGLHIDAAAVLGERAPEADRVITPWPSDHRAVLAMLRFGVDGPGKTGRIG
jgi:exodeoxyribonuclease III